VTENVPTPEVKAVAAGNVAAESDEVMATELANEVAVLLYASRAVTVTLIGAPAVAVVGAEVKTRDAAAPGLTVIALEVTLSPPPVAVTAKEPAVFSVTENVLTPEVKAAAAGNVAAVSVEVMATELANEVAVLLYASRAVTVTLIGVPAVAVVGAEVKTRDAAAPGLTVIAEEVIESPPPVAVTV
jgi:hypothetical protein